MINPGDAIDAIVGALQAIPELVTAIGGAQNVLPYNPSFPGSMYFRQDLDQLQPGQILVRYLGTHPAGRENRYWKHNFGLYQLPPNTTNAETTAGHYQFFLFVINGIPTNGNGNKFLDYAMVPNCDVMDVPTISIYTDLTLHRDYLLISLSFPEIGDN
jgi:hypothetical protein